MHFIYRSNGEGLVYEGTGLHTLRNRWSESTPISPAGFRTFSSSDNRQHVWCVGATNATDTSLFPVTSFYLFSANWQAVTVERWSDTQDVFSVKADELEMGNSQCFFVTQAPIKRTSATIPRPHFGATTLFWDPKQAQKGSVIMTLQSSHLVLCSKYHREWRSV